MNERSLSIWVGALRELNGDLTPEELGIMPEDLDYEEAYAAYRAQFAPRRTLWQRLTGR